MSGANTKWYHTRRESNLNIVQMKTGSLNNADSTPMTSSLVLARSVFFCDSGSAHVGHCSGHKIMVQVLLRRL